MTTVLAFSLLDRASLLLLELLRARTDTARVLVEQWQHDLSTVRAQLDGRACVYCGAQDQDMRPNEAWGEAPTGRFECIDADACETRQDARLDAEYDAYVEAQDVRSQAERQTEDEFREEESQQAREWADGPFSLDPLVDDEVI